MWAFLSLLDAITRSGALTLWEFKCFFVECWMYLPYIELSLMFTFDNRIERVRSLHCNTLETKCYSYLRPAHTGPYINVANFMFLKNMSKNAWA